MQINRTVYEQHHPLTGSYSSRCMNSSVSILMSTCPRICRSNGWRRNFCEQISHCTFSRMEIGMSIHQYISKSGWQRCREALLGDVPVTKVYLLFGFHDYSSFYRAFKKSTGSRRRILKNCIPLPAINTVVPNALFTLYFSGGFLICFRCGEN